MEQGRIDTVYIVGRGIGFQDVPQLMNPNEQRWGVNIVILRQPVEVGFDMHDDEKMTEAQMDRRKAIIQHAASMGIPVYSVYSIPNTTYKRYPIERVVGRFQTGYFSNAICYMIALAILEGVEHINLYGVVHLRTHKEYASQKPGVDYWLGRAKEAGVSYYVHGDYSEIGRTEDGLAYGYGLTSSEMVKRYG